MPRPYRPFPYMEILNDLLAGRGYRATAQKFGYYEQGKPDPTKSFRTLIRHARNEGFLHEGERVRFPRFRRDGQPVFGPGEMTPLMKSLMPTEQPQAKPKSEGNPRGTAKVKMVFEAPKGRRPTNVVFFVVDSARKLVTIRVPGPDPVVALDDLRTLFKTEPNEGKASSLFATESDDDLAWLSDQ